MFNEILSQVKDRVDISSACQAYGVQLHRRGNRLVGLCPFPDHQEKTGSFTVFDDEKFYCFGCHKHGDVIDLVRLQFGLSFRDSIAKLSRDFGIDDCGLLIPARPKKSNATRLREQYFGIIDSLLLDRKYLQYRLRQSVTSGAVLALGMEEALTFDLLFGWPEEQATALIQARRLLDGGHWRSVGEHPAA